jgi:hypothetical protein
MHFAAEADQAGSKALVPEGNDDNCSEQFQGETEAHLFDIGE